MAVGVYLASCIDQANVAQRSASEKVLFSIAGFLNEEPSCAWVFDPSKAFSLGGSKEMTPDIRAINGEALRRAGAMVAYLPAGVVSVGVPMEIDRAAGAGRMVLVISDADSQMLQFDQSNVKVASRWEGEARKWLSLALLRASEDPEESALAKVRVVLDKGAEEPRRGYEDDAGLDLVVSEARVVDPGEFVDVPCGVRAQLPDWSYGLIIGRSSTLRKRGLLVNQGVIDAGYRGPLFAGCWNMTDRPVKVLKGERIAQLIVSYNGTRAVQVEQTEKLSVGSRGDAGFGSTGT